MTKQRLLGTCLAFALAAAAAPAVAQDAYNIGVSGALTGPGAGTYAPVIEAMRIYVDELNAKGGVNGKKINLVVQDDQANPQKAAAEAKKLITQDNVLMLINVSLSSTYAPILAEASRAGVPVYFGGSVCATETYPKAEKLQFCTTAFGARYDSRYGLGLVKDVAKAPVKLGLVAMAIPISRNEIDWAEGHAKEIGLEPVAKDAVPPPTVDYGPVATKMKDAGATVVYPWAPWITVVRTLESLRKIGWDGTFVSFAHINAEDDLARLKDDKFFVYGANSFFSENLPVHGDIRAAAAKAGARSPVTQLAEGWIVGMTIEAIAKKVSWPPTREKVVAAMSDLEVDTKGLRGAPIVWTAENHFRTKQCYKAYKWDAAKNAIAPVRDWACLDVK